MYDTVLTAVVYVRPGPHLESVCYLTGETSILMQNHIDLNVSVQELLMLQWQKAVE